MREPGEELPQRALQVRSHHPREGPFFRLQMDRRKTPETHSNFLVLVSLGVMLGNEILELGVLSDILRSFVRTLLKNEAACLQL
ncbi:uncharacterized protein LOC130796341 isoform X1 [Actinidia eriantha]|uniref:uncharacterized protein LOC130796341 isoform X1 n=1 Tax=Actinidia eriantha TaxID=165200 RepID=UPI00258AF0ED|nr:uncharacterized protein LOC130796341 isoform X1 [Actinidia eriantha]